MNYVAWILLGAGTLACSGSAFTAAESSAAGSANGGGGDTAGAQSGGAVDGGGSPSVGGDSGSTAGGSDSAGGLGTSGTNGAGSTGAGGGANPPATACPEKLPASGEACEGKLRCSYGADVRTQCRLLASCDNGAWTLSKPDCGDVTECGALVKAGVVCEPMAEPCVNGESQYCACSACDGDVCGTKSTWHCAGGSSSGGCPRIAPNEGQSCSGNASCSYGGCGLGSGAPQAVQVTCNDTWSWQPSVCPQ